MSLYILDTDILSLWHARHPQVVQQIDDHQEHDLAITVITAQEQVEGRLTQVRNARNAAALARSYLQLARTITALGRVPILDYTEPAMARFDYLRSLRLNVGSQDLRIAAIALELDATVVTRNLRDFGRVPQFRCENWAA